MRISVLTILAFFILSDYAYTQDPSFSQFYANPLYLNPALAGAGDCSRLTFNYRNQWPSLSGNFTTYNASVDHHIRALSGGIGLIVMSDNQGKGMINTLRVSGMYSYHLELSYDVQLNAGIEATYHQQKLNWDKLIFADMIDPNSGQIGTSGEQPIDNTSLSVLDFSTGLFLSVKEKYYFGIAVDHLSQPTLNYYNNSLNSFLYRKYTFHAGGDFNLSQGSYQSDDNAFKLSPNILYQYQQGSQQINLGLYAKKSVLVAGVWYRYAMENSDAMIFLLGIIQKRFKFGYSYDVTMSRLKGISGGAHELSLTLFFACNKKRNRPGAIKCPEF